MLTSQGVLSSKISVGGRIPTYESILFEELLGVFEAVSELSAKFKQGFKRNANQRALRSMLDTTTVDINSSMHILLYGSTGSGKSWAALGEAWDLLCSYPNTNGLAVRRTSRDNKGGLFQDCKKLLDGLGILYKSSTDDKDCYIQINNGSRMNFISDKSLVQAGENKSHAIGGRAFSVVIFDEADSLSRQLALSISGRMREVGEFRRLIFYVCNPPSKHHWLREHFWGTFDRPTDPHAADSRYRVLQCNMENNEFIRGGYMKDAKEDFARDPSLAASLGDGDFAPTTAGTPYFGSLFSKEVHVAPGELIKTWNPNWPIQRSWDFGVNGHSCVLGQDDGDRRQVRVLASFLKKDMIWDLFADQVEAFCRNHFQGARYEDFCDPAGNQRSGLTLKTYVQAMRDRGMRPQFRVMPSVDFGLKLIEKLLQKFIKDRPSVLICPIHASDFIDALAVGYCSDDTWTGKGVKIIKDGIYDHLMDAFRYWLYHIRGTGSYGLGYDEDQGYSQRSHYD